jgi:hypothetical protein
MTSTAVAAARTRRLATAVVALATAVVAVVLGTVAGHRLAGPRTVLPPGQPTGVVHYPDDWQPYRAGERDAHAVPDEPWPGVGAGGLPASRHG